MATNPKTNATLAFQAIGSLVRPNRFAVSISFSGTQPQLDERVEAVEFPSVGLETADFKYNTHPLYKIPFKLQPAGTCNITFREKNDGMVLKTLYEQVSKFFSLSNGEIYVAYLDDLKGTINIDAYDQEDVRLYGLVLNDVILTNIDAVSFSYDDRDSYVKQTATFTYQRAYFDGPQNN